MTGSRVPAVAGIVFAISFVAGFLILGEAFGNFGDPDLTFVEYYAEDREYEIIGGYLLVVSAIAFVFFVAGIVSFLQERLSLTALTAIASACIFATLLSTAAAAVVAIPASRFFGGLFDDDGQLASEVAALPQLGYVLLFMPGVMFAVVAVASTALVMRRMPEVPPWIPMSGFVAAAALLFAGFFMPIAALPLWVLAASIGMLISHRGSVG